MKRSLLSFALLAAACCWSSSPAIAQSKVKAKAKKEEPAKTSKEELAKAAKFFEEGQGLYGKGRYAEAIMSYKAAHSIAPHPSALFNIARCFENLADPVEALRFYEATLKISTDSDSIADIKGRIQRLSTRPTKVFVSTIPPGASVTVDGKEKAEASTTPLVLHLRPGEHVLLLRKDGYHLAAQRVVVELDKEQPKQVTLKELPADCTPVKKCPKQKKCPKVKLTDTETLHMQLSVMGAFGFQHKRPASGGPGIHAYINIKNVIVGPSFLFFPGGEISIDESFEEEKYTEAELRWILVMAEAGYAFTFDTSYLYVIGGLGVSLDQVIYKGTKTVTIPDGSGGTTTKVEKISITKQEPAFAWTVGAGIEAFAATWLSVGAAFRFGFVHGTRLDAEKPRQTDDGSTFPIGSVWGTVTLHL